MYKLRISVKMSFVSAYGILLFYQTSQYRIFKPKPSLKKMLMLYLLFKQGNFSMRKILQIYDLKKG